MFSDYERIDFWKTKVKVTNCDNEKSWYHNKVGQIFDVDSTSARDFYIKEDNTIKCILIKDAQILN